ncbi:MAG: TraX family protein [Eubacteriales bacterium]|nr:TraX family protein [Eubacteriales bacterium]
MLKLFAALFMLLDHAGFYYGDVLPGFLVMLLRLAGRLAFPLFAWSVARGYHRTHNPMVYFLRMTAFALLAQVIIQPANQWIGLHMAWTNVLFTFTLAIVALAGYRLAKDSSRDLVASLRPIPAAPNTVPVRPIPPRFDLKISPGGITLDARTGLVLGSLALLAALLAAEALHTDYGSYGVLTVVLLYAATHRVDEAHWEQRIFQYLLPLNILFLVIRLLTASAPFYWAIMQLASLAAVPLMIAFQRDRKPPRWLKYGFYLFYPLHILALCAVRMALLGPMS